MSEILIKEYRGGMVDTFRRGDIAIVDAQGQIHHIGDGNKVAYYRSAVKPIQVLPFLMLGLEEKYRFTLSEIALTAASHLGRPEHVKLVLEMMAKVGVREEDMIMGDSYPQDSKEKRRLKELGEPPRKRYHNCSGKHTAMLGIAKALGEPCGHYFLPHSRTGKLALSTLSRFSGLSPEQIHIGVDGCGVPIYAVPLSAMARSFLAFFKSDLLQDDQLSRSASKMVEAYHSAPEMVRGTDTLCHYINRDPNLFGKLGANGVYCFAMKKEGLGIALKMEDGNINLIPPIIAHLLTLIGYDNPHTISAIQSLHNPNIYNDGGTLVGEWRCDFGCHFG